MSFCILLLLLFWIAWGIYNSIENILCSDFNEYFCIFSSIFGILQDIVNVLIWVFQRVRRIFWMWGGVFWLVIYNQSMTTKCFSFSFLRKNLLYSFSKICWIIFGKRTQISSIQLENVFLTIWMANIFLFRWNMSSNSAGKCLLI